MVSSQIHLQTSKTFLLIPLTLTDRKVIKDEVKNLVQIKQ